MSFLARVSRHPEVVGIRDREIPLLIERLPYGCAHQETFTREGRLWCFDFQCKFMHGQFVARALGYSPREAYENAREQVMRQIREWRRGRF